jgi:hypothetical protein
MELGITKLITTSRYIWSVLYSGVCCALNLGQNFKGNICSEFFAIIKIPQIIKSSFNVDYPAGNSFILERCWCHQHTFAQHPQRCVICVEIVLKKKVIQISNCAAVWRLWKRTRFSVNSNLCNRKQRFSLNQKYIRIVKSIIKSRWTLFFTSVALYKLHHVQLAWSRSLSCGYFGKSREIKWRRKLFCRIEANFTMQLYFLVFPHWILFNRKYFFYCTRGNVDATVNTELTQTELKKVPK